MLAHIQVVCFWKDVFSWIVLLIKAQKVCSSYIIDDLEANDLISACLSLFLFPEGIKTSTTGCRFHTSVNVPANLDLFKLLLVELLNTC